MTQITPRKSSYMLMAGYGALGLLIGYISGITNAEITKTIVTPLLVLIGGKLLIDISKKDHQQLYTLGCVLFFFCLSFFVGLNGGIFAKVNRILSLDSAKSSIKNNNDTTGYIYLRNGQTLDDIRTRYDKGEISKDSIIKLFFKSPKP